MHVTSTPVWTPPFAAAPADAPQAPAAPPVEQPPVDSVAPPSPSGTPNAGDIKNNGAISRMWEGLKDGGASGFSTGAKLGRKWAMQGLSLGLGLAGVGVTLYYAGSLWKESPILTLFFTIPFAMLTFKAGETAGKLIGAVTGPLVGAPIGAVLGAVKGAYQGLKGTQPETPPPTQPTP